MFSSCFLSRSTFSSLWPTMYVADQALVSRDTLSEKRVWFERLASRLAKPVPSFLFEDLVQALSQAVSVNDL